ncbi:MAG: hypothetical protein WAW61_22630 [Methylococcaceae bacterium]
MKNNVAVNAEQIKNKTGVQYRASGNLFIATARTKTVPSSYSGNRGDVVRFSAGSGIRMRRYLRECRTDYGHMVTLTYPYEYPSNGRETKEHLRRFLQELQRQDRRISIDREYRPPHSAFWFLEFQGRGAPHYHIFVNRPVNKAWCSRTWYNIVNSEDIRHLHAGTRCEDLIRGRAGTISYASKYAAKAEQKDVPPGFENVGRFWGVYGCRIVVSADTFVSRRDQENSETIEALKKIETKLKTLVSQGRAEIYKREEGCMIAIVKFPNDQMDMRRLVGMLNATVLRKYDMFEDAEVECGGVYG